MFKHACYRHALACFVALIFVRAYLFGDSFGVFANLEVGYACAPAKIWFCQKIMMPFPQNL